MNLLKFLVASIIAYIAVSVAFAKSNWELVEINKEGMSSYVDRSGVEVLKQTSSEKYVRVEFLFSFEQTHILTTAGKKIKVRSVVREVIIDCPTGKMMPVADYFYQDTMPDKKPSHIREYEASSDQVVTISKRSTAYITACPSHI